MKTSLLLFTSLWFGGSALGQQRGHYDLISVNETIRRNDYRVNVASWEQQKIEITVEKPSGLPLEIKIRDSDRQLISSRQAVLKQSLFREIINLSQLTPGRYWLEVRIGKELIRRELRIEATTQTYRSLTMH